MRNNLAKIIILVMILCLLTTSGCWSRREMEGLAYILVVGIDKTETGRIKMTVQVGLPAQEPGEGPMVHILKAEGRDIAEALDLMFSQSTKRPYLSHVRLIVLGETLAKDGINQVIDFLRRDIIQVRNNTKIAVTSDDLEELLTIESPLNNQPAMALIDLFNINQQRSRVVKVEVLDLAAMLLEPDLEVVLPKINKGEDTYTLGETIFFSGDRMVGELDRNLTPALLFLQNRVPGGVFTVPCGSSGHATTQIISSNTRLHTSWQDDRLQVRVEVEVNGRLIELACNDRDGEELEQRLAHYIINRMDDVVKLAQSRRTDFIGFSFQFRRDNPKQWREVHKNWADVLDEAEFDLRCRVNLRRQGQTPR